MFSQKKQIFKLFSLFLIGVLTLDKPSQISFISKDEVAPISGFAHQIFSYSQESRSESELQSSESDPLLDLLLTTINATPPSSPNSFLLILVLFLAGALVACVSPRNVGESDEKKGKGRKKNSRKLKPKSERIAQIPALRLMRELIERNAEEQGREINKEEALAIIGVMKQNKIINVPLLLALLRHHDLNVKKAAVVELSKIKPEREAIKLLIEALEMKDPEVVQMVSAALERKGKKVIPALASALGHPKWQVRVRVVHVLHLLGEGSIPTLLKALSDKKWEVRVKALHALGDVRPKKEIPEILPFLAGLFNDPDESVRRMAARVVGEMGESAFPMLCLAFRKDIVLMRVGAVRAFGHMGGAHAKKTVPLLLEALKDPELYVASSAIYALGHLGRAAKKAVPHLMKYLTHREDAMQYAAIMALSKMEVNTKEYVDFLICFLSSKDYSVQEQETAKDALKELDDKGKLRALPGLIKLLEKEAPQKVLHILASYGEIAKPAVPQLRKLLKSNNPDVLLFAIQALGAIGPEAKNAVPDLILILKNEKTRTYIGIPEEVANALGKIKAVEAVPALFAAAVRKGALTNYQALSALVSIGSQAVPFLIKALGSKDYREHYYAFQIIERVGEPAIPALVEAYLKNKLPKVRKTPAGAFAPENYRNRNPNPEASTLVERVRGAADYVSTNFHLYLKVAKHEKQNSFENIVLKAFLKHAKIRRWKKQLALADDETVKVIYEELKLVVLPEKSPQRAKVLRVRSIFKERVAHYGKSIPIISPQHEDELETPFEKLEARLKQKKKGVLLSLVHQFDSKSVPARRKIAKRLFTRLIELGWLSSSGKVKMGLYLRFTKEGTVVETLPLATNSRGEWENSKKRVVLFHVKRGSGVTVEDALDQFFDRSGIYDALQWMANGKGDPVAIARKLSQSEAGRHFLLVQLGFDDPIWAKVDSRAPRKWKLLSALFLHDSRRVMLYVDREWKRNLQGEFRFRLYDKDARSAERFLRRLKNKRGADKALSVLVEQIKRTQDARLNTLRLQKMLKLGTKKALRAIQEALLHEPYITDDAFMEAFRAAKERFKEEERKEREKAKQEKKVSYNLHHSTPLFASSL